MRAGQECSIADEGLDCTVEVYMSEESEERVTVVWSGDTAGGSSKSESCQEL